MVNDLPTYISLNAPAASCFRSRDRVQIHSGGLGSIEKEDENKRYSVLAFNVFGLVHALMLPTDRDGIFHSLSFRPLAAGIGAVHPTPPT